MQKHKQILVIEDDPDIRDLLGQILELEGYPVRTAANGREALDYLEANQSPGLILLDVMMPVMGGSEFRNRQMKNQKLAAIPTIVISALNENQQTSGIPGARCYLKKPLDLDELLSEINAA